MAKARVLFRSFSFLFVLALLAAVAFAQETTGGLQGTVRDPTSAVVANAHVDLTGTSLVGKKDTNTDAAGYFRFANLPPGIYAVTITAKGFSTQKREGLAIEIGHLPTVDFKLEVGASSTVVEVTAAAPVIDVTTNVNQTNLTAQELDNTPHGYSFQSVIQFAPMARNEPLSGMTINGMASGGTGGALPGSAGNGNAFGYSVGGAADSETTYLVEGQDTENISGGISSANVPFQFIQEVQVKSSGIEAEYGGALGGVVNVVMKKGSNAYHGSIFGSYESDGMDGNPANPYLRYDPININAAVPPVDNDAQIYSALKQHYRIAQPGFTVGGPIFKDRLWFFFGFAPQYQSHAETVNFDQPDNVIPHFYGPQFFTQDNQTYFGSGRLDLTVTQKIRVFGSWLYQYQRESGTFLPVGDPISQEVQNPAYINTFVLQPLGQFNHGAGFSAPNATYNTGADITLTPKIVSTTRFGYYFTNYHDFGWPTTTPNLDWFASGTGADGNCTPQPCTPSSLLPKPLQQPLGTFSAPWDQSYTLFNANKHYQFDEDVAFFKSGWWGTHNFKVGYQYNHLSNVINQNGSVPEVYMYTGTGNYHSPATVFGAANCATLTAVWGGCAGQYGYAQITDFATYLPVAATDTNHGLFAQDAWTIGHGVTLNLGIRIEKETLPPPQGVTISSINFDWSDKIEPRLGAAWDVMRNGKLKVFGSYGVVNDVMKLLIAQTSWGAQVFEQCTYALGPDSSGNFTAADLAGINPVFLNYNGQLRACPNGPANLVGNFKNPGNAPPSTFVDSATGVSLIENVNLRPREPIAPNVKPYRQHEYVTGVDYQISKDWAFEARYDRRRLDHIIEDASLADPQFFELYTIVNPGQGVNSTLDGYANYLHSIGDPYGVPNEVFNQSGLFGKCPSCPPNPEAIRNYDGLEFRLTHATSKHWNGMFSYTWSSLWGNYTGLTTTDQIDGGITGRNSPDTTRSFDEPFYYYGANGKSNAGPLPTDRPNTFKGNVYYTLPWWKHQTTTFGIFQYFYQGSPMSSYTDIGLTSPPEPIEATYIFGRGKWANITQNPTTGVTTVGTPYNRRTPWYIQSNANIGHEIKTGEHQALGFTANFENLFNQHQITAYWGGFNSEYFGGQIFPYQIFNGAAFYKAVESGYNVQQQLNAYNGVPGLQFTSSSQYGKPYLYQLPRAIRVGVHYTF